MKLGFFDSGLGGFSIMKAVEEFMPQYEYVYYGDTLNLPYGDKTEEEIFAYTKTGVDFLFKKGAILVVLACNTASAKTLRVLQDTYLVDKHPERRILGVIIPTVEEIIESGSQKPLLIATKRTIDSNKYPLEFVKFGVRNVELTSLATPTLVPLIEKGDVSGAFQEVQPIIEKHLESGGDSIVLGCTHYTVLASYIRSAYGDRLKILSQDEIIPTKLKTYLDNHPEVKEKLSTHDGKEIREAIFRTKD